MQTSCKYESFVSAFIDDELPKKDAMRMRTHLAGCALCRNLVKTYGQTDQLISGLPEMMPSPDFDYTFYRKLERIKKRPIQWPRLGHLVSGWRPVYAAVLVVCLIIGIELFPKPKDGPDDPERLFLSEHVDFFQDFEIIQNLEFFENLESFAEMAENS